MARGVGPDACREVLQQLWDAGLRTIPGGGAEILSDRVKQKISNKKGTSADWLAVMREAHSLGYKTTATMMYGHLETDEDIVEHLEVDPQAAGRRPRVHGVHPVELQAGEHAAREDHPASTRLRRGICR